MKNIALTSLVFAASASLSGLVSFCLIAMITSYGLNFTSLGAAAFMAFLGSIFLPFYLPVIFVHGIPVIFLQASISRDWPQLKYSNIVGLLIFGSTVGLAYWAVASRFFPFPPWKPDEDMRIPAYIGATIGGGVSMLVHSLYERKK